MKYTYPAVFYPEDSGGYSIIFPDLNDLATQGDDLVEAMTMAEEACSLFLFTSLKDGETLPCLTSINEVEKEEDSAFVSLILVDLARYMKTYSNRPQLKNTNKLKRK